jgi:aryl-alcohol dehydrogenase-like predicted oxidoreductase
VRALWVSDRRNLVSYVSVQPEYNLLEREVEAEIVPCCLEFGLGLIPYFPLAAGVLTGKYKPGEAPPEGTRGHDNPRFAARLQPRTLEAVQRLDAWARERDHTVGELAIAWLASRPAVSTIITGVTKPEQVVANARAVEWQLSSDEIAEVDRLLGERAGD